MLTLTLVCLSSCGTEIGNGKKPPGPDEIIEQVSDKDSDKSPVVKPATANESEASNNPTIEPAVPTTPMGQQWNRILSACASPISEMPTATFDDTLGSQDFTVSALSATSWSLSLQEISYAIELDPAGPYPYAIKSAAAKLNSVACIDVSIAETAAGRTRTVEYADGFKTIWILDTDFKVRSIEILNDTGSKVGQWNRL